MKTIFIPIYSRPQARNVLRTDIFKTLISHSDIRVVVFVPKAKKGDYELEFVNPRVIFEAAEKPPEFISSVDKFFGRLALFYIDTPTARSLRRQWLWFGKRRPFRYTLSMLFLVLIGNVKLFRRLLRFLDRYLVNDDRFGTYFEKYKPSLVFLPHLAATAERSFLRSARRRGIGVVGMIHAWDNITLSKYPFRLLPDKLVVYNEIIRQEAIKYLEMLPKDLYVSGWPHFDFYFTTQPSSRETFCRQLAIDPKKRIILFASIGSTLNPTEWQVLQMLKAAAEGGELPADTVIVFRQHPTEKTKMGNVRPSGRIIIDDSKTVLRGSGSTEILAADMEHLANSLYHAAVTINTASTMSIDAAVFDKSIINIAFDGWEKKPFHESVRRFYAPSHVHYQPIVKSGGVRIVYSFPGLLQEINRYLANPRLETEGRKRIVREQCWKLDGQAGKRICNFLLKNLT